MAAPIDWSSAERRRLADRRASSREFVAVASHEMRTPIAAIRGCAETLLKGGIEDAENRLEFVRMIDKNAQRLAQLVEDILELSALEAGQRPPRLEEVELSSFIEGFLRTIDPLIRQKRIKVGRSIEPLKVSADPAQLLRVLQNVFSNAIKFSAPGGAIGIGASRSGARCVLTVTDRGMGIEPEHLPHVFEKFNHLRRADGPQEGTGLGLSIVKQLVEGQGGSIEIESVPNKGTCVRVFLKLASHCRS